MTTVRTDLGNTRESARRIRVEPYNLLTATNVQQALQQFASAIPPTVGIRVVTAAGAVAVANTDIEVGINKTVGAATTVNLPSAATWLGATNTEFDLTIKDLKGDANTNNITVVPNGAETIDGLASWLINLDFGAVRLRPRTDGTGWYVR